MVVVVVVVRGRSWLPALGVGVRGSFPAGLGKVFPDTMPELVLVPVSQPFGARVEGCEMLRGLRADVQDGHWGRWSRRRCSFPLLPGVSLWICHLL